MQVLEKEYPGCLFDVINLTVTTSIFPESVINVFKCLLKHINQAIYYLPTRDSIQDVREAVRSFKYRNLKGISRCKESTSIKTYKNAITPAGSALCLKEKVRIF